ncbi:MAG: acyl-CoA dehydrogenase family protein, partial [Advenella sp.]
MNYDIPEEFVQLAELTRRFVQKELWPQEAVVERLDEIPRDLRMVLRAKARELGLFAFNMPESAGGPGLPCFAQVLIREQLGQAGVALANLVGRPPKALIACSAEQRSRFLDAAVRGDQIWAFALSEPGAGSDAMALSSRAVRDGKGWRLNGTKHFISHGNEADFVLVIANAETPAGRAPTAFIVAQEQAGFTVGRVQQKMGWRGYPICELFFNDVFVPDENILGDVGQGIKLGLANIQDSRIG